MAKVSWIAIYVDFLQIFLTVTQTMRLRGFIACTKNDVKRPNKHKHLGEVNAKHLLSPTNSLNGPILNPQGSYTNEQHSFTRHYALHYTIQKAREAVTGYIERKKKLSLHNMAKF